MSGEWIEERKDIELKTRAILTIEDKKKAYSDACNEKIKMLKAEIKAILDHIDAGVEQQDLFSQGKGEKVSG